MKRFFWLALIFVLALVLRIWNLANLPMGFTPDEAAFGYNAFSLLKTGKDEWGTAFYQLPVVNLQSFGDYKLPLYAFLTVPTVAIFGLNEFATRLPNAIFGSFAVFAIYILAKYLTPNPSPKLKEGNRRGEVQKNFGIFAAFLLAVSPWSIQLSRGAFEANLVTLLLPLFLALFLSQKYFFALLILALNFYSYHSARFLSLILLPILLYKSKKYLLFLLFIPGFFSLLGSGGARSSDVSILSPTDNWKSVADSRFSAVQSGLPDSLARIFYNKVTYVFSQFTKNFVTYFSPQFLFTEGPHETTYGMHPGTGVMYPIEVVFLLLVIKYLIKNPSKNTYYYLLLLLLTVVPAALAKGPGAAANRAAPMLPILILLSSLGMSLLSKYINRVYLYILISLSLCAFAINYVFHARDLAPGMLFGRKEAISRVANLSKDYAKIFVSTSISEPHIYVAFFNQLDPETYQKQTLSWQIYHDIHLKFLDQLDGYSLDKYTFGRLKFNTPNSLYVGLPQDFPSQLKPMFTIDYPDGYPAVIVSRL